MKDVNISWWEMGLVKLSVIAFAFFVIQIWPAAMNWVHGVNAWWFFVLFVVFAIKPMITYYK
ncbi:hypothetical protein HON86_03165 [Candidatus Woesearchaeota archaeon]|jgi:hypothetical protein|nr:hypothetical protein [Candidatus Woesearchaeota archaeon]MBT4835588.1 hypothetical protein [Candidatus Woesearchaeota archaeon]MBT7169781.1 hypothetical protein [Candidatus Woesearchaeota archaeon]